MGHELLGNFHGETKIEAAFLGILGG